MYGILFLITQPMSGPEGTGVVWGLRQALHSSPAPLLRRIRWLIVPQLYAVGQTPDLPQLYAKVGRTLIHVADSHVLPYIKQGLFCRSGARPER